MNLTDLFESKSSASRLPEVAIVYNVDNKPKAVLQTHVPINSRLVLAVDAKKIISKLEAEVLKYKTLYKKLQNERRK